MLCTLNTQMWMLPYLLISNHSINYFGKRHIASIYTQNIIISLICCCSHQLSNFASKHIPAIVPILVLASLLHSKALSCLTSMKSNLIFKPQVMQTIGTLSKLCNKIRKWRRQIHQNQLLLSILQGGIFQRRRRMTYKSPCSHWMSWPGG